ncbi:MAG: lactate utilization protein [Clostridia bacterium]|nr:lactate utilization protein [Clostridia bacterium]MBR6741474.1 lactate utilization protein [Clostridia bacterium]
MCENIKITVENLKKNNINAIYCETKQDVVAEVKGMLEKGASISTGGSVSLVDSGVWELINNGDYNFRNRNRPGITPEEQQQVFKDVIGIDYYLCSANAVTKNGEILNVDGFSNRITAIAFGPKKVIMVVGKNKIVDNLNDAFLRVKKIAAPKNCVRLGIDNPCAKLGHCISLEKSDNPDFADGCKSARRICVNYLVNGFQRDNGRLNVILCGEDLGY